MSPFPGPGPAPGQGGRDLGEPLWREAATSRSVEPRSGFVGSRSRRAESKIESRSRFVEPRVESGSSGPRSRRRSPYAWGFVGLLTVVALAWLLREGSEPVVVGTRAPDFEAVALDGVPLSVTGHRGKVVLLNVWATWCPPCLEEMPSMQRLYDEFSGRGLEILAVSVDAPFGESDAAGRPGGRLDLFRDELGLTFPILHDPEGRVQRVYGTTGVPETFLIGRDGLIYKKVAGGTQWDSQVNRELVSRLIES